MTPEQQTADQFAAVLGSVRGSGRDPADEPEVIAAVQRRRRILALVAAHGILAHNTAVEMPGRFSAGRIAAFVEHGGQGNLPSYSPVSDELQADLAALTAAGLLASWGERWKVTPAGLVELWTGPGRA